MCILHNLINIWQLQHILDLYLKWYDMSTGTHKVFSEHMFWLLNRKSSCINPWNKICYVNNHIFAHFFVNKHSFVYVCEYRYWKK